MSHLDEESTHPKVTEVAYKAEPNEAPTDTETMDKVTPAGTERSDVKAPPDPSTRAKAVNRPRLERAVLSRNSSPSSPPVERAVSANVRLAAFGAVVFLLSFGLVAGGVLLFQGSGDSEPADLNPAQQSAVAPQHAEIQGVQVHKGGLKRKPLPPKRNLALPVQNSEEAPSPGNVVPDPTPPPGPEMTQGPVAATAGEVSDGQAEPPAGPSPTAEPAAAPSEPSPAVE